jgi:hypothetical protein
MRTKTLLIASAAALAAAITTSQAQTVYSQNVVGYVNTPLTPGFTMINNPLNGATNGAEAVMPGLVGQENLFIWNGHGYFVYTFQGAGVGTGLGYQSDWTDGSSAPPAAPSIPGAQTDTVDGLYWVPQPVLNPGQGFFVQNPNAAETNTFTGTVVTTNSQSLSPGFSMVASAIPVGGDVETNPAITLTTHFAGQENVFVWNGHGYFVYTFQGAGVGTGLGYQSDWTDGSSAPPAAPSIPGVQTDTVDGLYWTPALQLSVGQGIFIQNPNSAEQWTQVITNIP